MLWLTIVDHLTVQYIVILLLSVLSLIVLSLLSSLVLSSLSLLALSVLSLFVSLLVVAVVSTLWSLLCYIRAAASAPRRSRTAAPPHVKHELANI